MTRHFSVAIMALFSTIGCSAPTSAGPDASNVTEKAMANAAMPQAPSAVEGPQSLGVQRRVELHARHLDAGGPPLARRPLPSAQVNLRERRAVVAGEPEPQQVAPPLGLRPGGRLSRAAEPSRRGPVEQPGSAPIPDARRSASPPRSEGAQP